MLVLVLVSPRLRFCHPLFLLGSLTVLACQEQTMPVETDAGTTGSSSMPDTPSSTLDTPTTTPNLPTTTSDPESTTTTTTTTGDDTNTDSANVDTTTGSSGCGDGIVGPDEECDEGPGINDDNLFCKENCKLNVCGDGKLFVGWELCDDGAANSDEYGSLCSTHCEPGARCGDNKLQPEFETCDLGINNGGQKGNEQGIACDASCRAQRLRGFITQDAFDGNLGGLFGADLKCRTAATMAGLAEPERFHAFLSTGDVDAKTRFEKVAASWPYVLVTGKKFADSFAALIEQGPLGEGISVTEHGSALYTKDVATNTAPGGGSFSPDQHCQGWTSADPVYSGRVGLNGFPKDSPDAGAWNINQWWTGIKSWQCNKTLFRLYCLEI